MSNLINTNRFFKQVLPFIGSKSKVVDELIENAIRAKASKVDISLDGCVIRCVNNGQILDDFTSLLTVATTDYDADVIESQLPAGMGIMMMLSASNKVVFHSGDKLLTVDSGRFFDDESYREELSLILKEQSCLQKNEFVDGFVTTLYCDESFVQSLIDLKMSKCYEFKKFNGVAYSVVDKYKYYDIDININGFAIEKKEHQWLVHQKGDGIFQGCEVGIKGGVGNVLNIGEQGAVYWFGKYINCEAIAPFTIVVNEKTSCLTPALPDRTGISTNLGELSALKQELEKLFEAGIQKRIVDESDGNSNCIVELLKSLNASYDVEHFRWWDMVYIDSLDVVYDANSSIILNGNEHELSYFTDNIKEIKLRFGGTSAPQSILNKYADKLDVFVEYGKCDGEEYIGNSQVRLVDSIRVNGFNVDWVEDCEDCEVLFIPDVDWSFVSVLFNRDCGCGEQVSEYEYEKELITMLNYYSNKIDASDFKSSINALLPSGAGSLKEMVVEFGDGLLKVKLQSGEVHELKVA